MAETISISNSSYFLSPVYEMQLTYYSSFYPLLSKRMKSIFVSKFNCETLSKSEKLYHVQKKMHKFITTNGSISLQEKLLHA